MVAAVRQGLAQRRVAGRFHVSLRTVQYWVTRAGNRRLDRVDWTDHRRRSHRAPHRTSLAIEARILDSRQSLRQDSILGEYGAARIREVLLEEGIPVPSVRTIGRILVRRGALDRRQRIRRPPPPPGWHLPAVRDRAAELELFDFVEMLKLAEGPLVDVFTGVALHGGGPLARPLLPATTTAVLAALQAHWQAEGLPHFAQFDNDTRFQGAHPHPDIFGRVVRFCLQLAITPVFVPPRELGFQNPVEHFNGLWQSRVWHRQHFASFAALLEGSAQYLAARRQRLAARISAAPPRHPWPSGWHWEPAQLRPGTVIYIRRTSEPAPSASWGTRGWWIANGATA